MFQVTHSSLFLPCMTRFFIELNFYVTFFNLVIRLLAQFWLIRGYGGTVMSKFYCYRLQELKTENGNIFVFFTKK